MLKNPQIVLKQLSNPSRDERGITLQTLIVTAVLVLMAVAAGVVVVAITNSASDDLSEQSPDLEAKCAPWEFHDPEREALGIGGGEPIETERITTPTPGRGGVTSSGIGCFAPCYLSVHTSQDEPNAPFEDRTLDQFVKRMQANPNHNIELSFATTNEKPEINQVRIGVTYERDFLPNVLRSDILEQGGETWPQLVAAADDSLLDLAEELILSSVNGYVWDLLNWPALEPVGTNIPPKEKGSNLVIRVTNDQEGCILEDTSTKVIHLDSRE